VAALHPRTIKSNMTATTTTRIRPLATAELAAVCQVAMMLRSLLHQGVLEDIALAEVAAALPGSYSKFSAAVRRGCFSGQTFYQFAESYGARAEQAA
jgi:hypothetical protein